MDNNFLSLQCIHDNYYYILYQKNTLIKSFLTNISEFDRLYVILCISNFRWFMKDLKEILTSRQGIYAVITITIGILIASLGGKLLQNHKWYDFIVIAGAIISVIGTQQLSQLIIAKRNNSDD